MLLSSETPEKTSAGDSVTLNPQQIVASFESKFPKLNIVTGPPGSGKSVMGQYLYKYHYKLLKGQVLYICGSKAFQTKLQQQGIDNTEVITDLNLKNSELHALSKYACIIIDDAQNLRCRHAVYSLNRFFLALRDRKLIVLLDSNIQHVKQDHMLEQLDLETVYEDVYARKPTHSHLTEIHRNSQITAFISKCNALPQIESLKTSSPYEADGMEVLEVQDIWAPAVRNQLIDFVKTITTDMIEMPGSHYQTSDIAILFDSKPVDKDISRMREIFESAEFVVQDACQFPRNGIIIDSLDSFVGIASNVVIYIMSKERLKKRTRWLTAKRRSLTNPHYCASIASRAISKLVFVFSERDLQTTRHLPKDTFGTRHSQLRPQNSKKQLKRVGRVGRIASKEGYSYQDLSIHSRFSSFTIPPSPPTSEHKTGDVYWISNDITYTL